MTDEVTHDPDERPAVPELTNPRAERVLAVRALAGRSARQRSARFLVEGPQGVREALRDAAGAVRQVYLTTASAARYPQIAAEAERRGLVQLATAPVLAAMSADAQEVLAVLDAQPTDLTQILRPTATLVAVLVNVRDPGNAGAVIRTADAAGADAVVLSADSVDLHNPKVVRSTAGSLFHLPVVAGVPLGEVVARLRAAGLAVLAADGSGGHDLDELLDAAGPAPARPAPSPAAGPGSDQDLDADAPGVPDLRKPTAWLFGNEAWGLRAEDLALADAVVRVPIHGRAESLNLATAAAVCLYASARAQRHLR